MSHALHLGPPGTVWHDDCPECDARAAALPGSLGDLDDLGRIRAWRRMFAWRWAGANAYGELREGFTPTDNDAKLYDCLYAMAVYLERAGISPGEVEARMISAAEESNKRAEAAGFTARIPLEDL